jgi:predicted extracellular nuclease
VSLSFARSRPPLAAAMAFLLVATLLPTLGARPARAISPAIVISQVYGGGGNSGATYTNDFIELFNRGTTTVSVAGWSVQYASATGTGNFGANSNQLTELPNVSLAPGQYLLVQEAQGSGGTTPLPTPDVTDATPINMSGTGGKVALVQSAVTLGCNGGSTACSADQLALIVDLVGWDGANFFEGAAAPATTNSTAIFRNTSGCTETDVNSLDFTAGTPTPRNTASPLYPCVESAPGVVSTYPADGAADFPVGANLSVTFSEPVNITGSTFDLDCSVSGTDLAMTVSGGPTTFTLDPGITLVGGESCTLTVLANQVSDQDGNDPPDNMTADAVISFSPYDVCAQPYTPIYDIQGSGLSAAITGNVTTEGVVVGDFEGSASQSGFFLQDATGDGDPATSDGIFVYTGSSDLVSAGQLVRVTGYARERFNQTTINGSNSNSSAVPAANIVSCGTGSVPATDVTMPFASLDYPERYEGMFVRLPQALVISEYFNYDRFGEIVLAAPLAGESRPFTGTAIDGPGAPANARTLANSLSRITLDDAQSAQNPPVLRHPNGNPFSLTNRFRGGDTVQNTVGVLGYDFSLYRIFPTGPADYTAVNLRPAQPEDVGGSLRVAAMNTLNFFITADYPTGDPLDNKCGPLNNVECRGWDSDQVAEFTRQRDKLLAAIVGLDADVVGLNELENTTGVEPLESIVSGLNAMLGAGTYAYIATSTIGSDAIKVGLIYRAAAVTPVGAFQTLDSTDDPRFLDTKNRPTLAQTFQENATGARFTIAVNHFKSKGSDCLDVGDPDTGDGQGNCNLTRTAAAQALVDWLATDPTGSGDPDFLIMGDLNSYAMEDPIGAIKAGPDDTLGTSDDYTNLISKFQGTYAYSYLFDGQFGYLDQALASSSIVGRVTGAADWHINADEPDVLDYDTTFKPPEQDALYEANAYRSSDHDPVVVGLDLGIPTTTTLAVDPASQQYSDKVDLVATVDLVPPVSPSTASGTVKFQKSTDGGVTFADIGSQPVSGGVATLSDVQILDAAGTAIVFKALFDGTNDYVDSEGTTALGVTRENATVLYDGANPVAAQVDSPGSGSWTGPFSLSIGVKERTPDTAGTGTAGLGDISRAELEAQLVPLGPGPSIDLTCIPAAVTGSGYDATRPFTCSAVGPISLGTYEVAVSVEGKYYSGTYGDAFTVYDPSLGFATGGGHFMLDGDKVSFGFTTKYNKKGTNIQGNLMVVRHLPDGTVSRLKSNALGGLAILDVGGCGVATFSGKATYTTWDAAADGGAGAYVTNGNMTFAVRADDCNNPGSGTDKIWIGGPGDLAMPSPARSHLAALTGGNIAVPHSPAR